ncbi:Hypothetical predicted protein [Olea europaea subsp. europaea]|uniref:Uncharacterized protein n=2 Tax=Olea europaea subsp. europaea TaxID=158383 RepID=A0A8S0U7V7_OLEEU|nr:Hypothetical predicted protein [Olea europaea subsp. europaea]
MSLGTSTSQKVPSVLRNSSLKSSPMAAAAASSSNSVSNSVSSVTPPPPPKQEQQGISSVNKVSDEQNKGSTKDPFEDIDNKEQIDKFQKYEADYKRYLMSKYFSDKTIFGGNIFDVKMNIDGQTITASRLPPYQSYLDPASFDELNDKGPTTATAETPTDSTSNGKPSTNTSGNS